MVCTKMAWGGPKLAWSDIRAASPPKSMRRLSTKTASSRSTCALARLTIAGNSSTKASTLTTSWSSPRSTEATTRTESASASPPPGSSRSFRSSAPAAKNHVRQGTLPGPQPHRTLLPQTQTVSPPRHPLRQTGQNLLRRRLPRHRFSHRQKFVNIVSIRGGFLPASRPRTNAGAALLPFRNSTFAQPADDDLGEGVRILYRRESPRLCAPSTRQSS